VAYLVLARKYRPQTFEEIIGQAHITKTLQNALSSGRIAHAYLFSGTRGVGKTTAARILAKALNCAEGPTPKPCGQCPSCKSITAGSSVDVFEIDGASNTGVDDVRQLRENVKYAPSIGRYKVYIIDEVHMLSTSAFNALLKTLEEPPAHVVFIFATTDPHKIPETILSRCQSYDFKLIPLPLLLQALKDICAKEKIDLADDLLMLIARKADGSLRDAFSYLDQTISFGADKITRRELIELLGVIDREFLIGLVKSILDGDVQDVLQRFEQTAEFSFEPRQFYQDLTELLRDIVVVKASKNPHKLVVAPDAEIAGLVDLAKEHSFDSLQRQFDLLIAAESDILRAGHPRLILEMTLVKMAYTKPVLPLDDLIKKLDQLLSGSTSGKTKSNPPPVQSTPGRSSPKQSGDLGKGKRETRTAEGASPSDKWQQLIKLTKQKKLGAGTLLSNGEPELLSPEKVRIKLAPAFITLLGRDEDKQAIREAIAQMFGPDAELEYLPVEMENNNHNSGVAISERSDRLRALKKEALEAPAVKKALDMFDGELIDIKIGGNKS